MPVEARTRIAILLPAPTTFPLYLLVDQVLTDLTTFCGGATHSIDISPVFRGLWLDVITRTVKSNEIMLIFGDANVPRTSPGLQLFLDRLKLRCQRDFSQDIIWITVQDIYRVTTDDRRR